VEIHIKQICPKGSGKLEGHCSHKLNRMACQPGQILAKDGKNYNWFPPTLLRTHYTIERNDSQSNNHRHSELGPNVQYPCNLLCQCFSIFIL
jgi:hypothetical protein